MKELIAYDDKLIATLKTEHQDLLAVYGSIMELAEKKDYSLLTPTLVNFLDALRAHLNAERIDLYMYIELVLCKQRNICDKDSFRDLRLELSKIVIAASNAVNQYVNVPVDDNTVEKFIEDFTGLGQVLVGRIEQEEGKIFSIYSGSELSEEE